MFFKDYVIAKSTLILFLTVYPLFWKHKQTLKWLVSECVNFEPERILVLVNSFKEIFAFLV